MTTEADLPRVCLMMVPATLPARAARRDEPVRYHQHLSGHGRMTGEELLAELPELAGVARIEVDAANEHLANTPGDLVRLSRHVSAVLARPDMAGAVIVHGTNALEETAFFLHLTVASDKPVVLTGAQRPFTALGTDGPANLYDAVRVAAAPDAQGMGVLAVANNEIHAARDVTKTSTYRVHTFRSRDSGALGVADADRIVFYRAALRRPGQGHAPLLACPAGEDGLPRVDIVYVHAGATGDMARAAADLGARGIVVAGSGAGSTADMRTALAELSSQRGVVVVRSARVGEGRVLRDDNWQEPGWVAADNLNPQKAALLLALALHRTHDPDEIQGLFDTL